MKTEERMTKLDNGDFYYRKLKGRKIFFKIIMRCNNNKINFGHLKMVGELLFMINTDENKHLKDRVIELIKKDGIEIVEEGENNDNY